MDLENIQAYVSRGYGLRIKYRIHERRYHAFVDLGTTSTSHNFMAPSVKEALDGLDAYLRSVEASPPELWAVHIIGPDDLYAAPSEAEANRAVSHMKHFWETRHPEEAAMGMVGFEAIPWPHSPESHAEGVGKFYAEIGMQPLSAGDQHG